MTLVASGDALAEIDENLMRADLTAAERAKALKARKKAYQDAHPEAKRGETADQSRKLRL
ncbi:hypothetical protein ACTGJ9_020905 [Bradyrhizobium sp. RDM12]